MVTEMDRASEALIVERSSAPGPTTASSARRAPTAPAPAACAGSSTRSTAPPTTSTASRASPCRSRAEVDGAVVAGVVVRRRPRRAVRAPPAAAAPPATARRSAPSGATDLPHALVATGFSYDPERRRAPGRGARRACSPTSATSAGSGAAAVDLCSVACGRVDAYYERGLAPWDLAAGGLIAAEAGAVVTDLDGGPPRRRRRGRRRPGIARALRALLADAGARRRPDAAGDATHRHGETARRCNGIATGTAPRPPIGPGRLRRP